MTILDTAAYSNTRLSVHHLPNGLTVALEQLPYLHSITAGMWIKTGSANESEEWAGISHFLEHLLFKGTESRSAHDLMEAVEKVGGHMNAFTSRDYTCLYVKTLKEHIGAGIEILADILKHSTFADFESERNVILEEIMSNEDVPEDFVHDLMFSQIWPGHPLGRPITGSTETVGNLDLDAVKAYHAERYSPENMVLAIAGNFDEDTLMRQIREEFEELSSKSDATGDVPPAFTGGIAHVERNIAQDHVTFAFPAAAVTDDERYVFEVLAGCLGGGSTSRLFERIREEEGLAYAIYAFQSSYLQSGMFGGYAAIAPSNLQKTVDLCFEEFRKVREGDLTEDEVELNRAQLKGAILMSLESTFNRMARMGRSLLYYGRVLPVAEIIESVEAVTSERITNLSQRLFKPDQCALTILGPSNGATITSLDL